MVDVFYLRTKEEECLKKSENGLVNINQPGKLEMLILIMILC